MWADVFQTRDWGKLGLGAFLKSFLKANQANQVHCQVVETWDPLLFHGCSASPEVSKPLLLAQCWAFHVPRYLLRGAEREDAQMPWFPNLRLRSPALSEGLLGSRKVSIAARLQQAKSKKAIPVVITQMMANSKESRPLSLSTSLSYASWGSFLFPLCLA